MHKLDITFPPTAGQPLLPKIQNQPCAICGMPGATIMIARALPDFVAAKLDCEPTLPGTNAELAFVSRAHFPAAFGMLPPRLKRIVVDELWERIDAHRGRMAVAVRLPAVRTKIVASVEGGAALPAPCSPPPARRRSVWCVLRSALLATRAKRAKLTSGLITFVTFFQKGQRLTEN
jgi:hypothetical protein